MQFVQKTLSRTTPKCSLVLLLLAIFFVLTEPARAHAQQSPSNCFSKDCDGDGIPTDNDGIPARQEPNPTHEINRALWFSFHLGHNFPLGSFRREFNSGPSITGDVEYQFNRRASVYGMLGYHYFNDKDNIGPDLNYTNVSLNLRGYFPVSTWQGYVQAGPGLYHPNIGPNKFGFNVGTGLDFPINSRLAIELGTDLHVVNPGGLNRVFIDPKLGIKFRF